MVSKQREEHHSFQRDNFKKIDISKAPNFRGFLYVKIRILGNARHIIEIQNRLILFEYILEKYYGKIKFRIVQYDMLEIQI